ncbi:MAG: dihydroorotate dehydrogenase electron transfer subunit [Planctomycetota bacterium]
MPAVQTTGEIIANKLAGQNCYRMSLAVTPSLSHITPGQFIHLKLPTANDPLIRRPFSIYDQSPGSSKEPSIIEILYQIVGRGTRLMTTLKPSQKIDLIGPLGQGFKINKKAAVSILAIGGIGAAGLHLLLKELIRQKMNSGNKKIYILIGAKTKEGLYILDAFKKLESDIMIATEDGSAGIAGRTTDLLNKLLLTLSDKIPAPIQIYACGPTGMARSLQPIVFKTGVACQISLEAWMGCGIGICRACACKIKQKGITRYAMICKEGPVLDAGQICF